MVETGISGSTPQSETQANWRKRICFRILLGCVLVVLVGCRTMSQSASLSQVDYSRLRTQSTNALVNAKPSIIKSQWEKLNPFQAETDWYNEAGQNATKPVQQAGYATLKLEDHHTLVLSGGGQYGAFSVGVLKGWSQSGKRPDFNVVTGISTGALIAPFAFLGSQYDDVLVKNYLSTSSTDIYRKKSWMTVLWDDSVADPKPFRRKIEAEVTPEIVELIAQRHQKGHRLYIGTTDLRRRKLVTWDIGAIASGERKDKVKLIQRLMLASCSVPGFFPPVGIEIEVDGQRYVEYHVDGSVAASILLQPEMLPGKDSNQQGHVHVIVAGNAETESTELKHKAIPLVMDALAGVMQTRFELDLMNAYLMANWSGASFEMTAVPNDISANSDMLSFSPELMNNLYQVGQQLGVASESWQKTVPHFQPEQQEGPRSGTLFTTK